MTSTCMNSLTLIEICFFCVVLDSSRVSVLKIYFVFSWRWQAQFPHWPLMFWIQQQAYLQPMYQWSYPGRILGEVLMNLKGGEQTLKNFLWWLFQHFQTFNISVQIVLSLLRFAQFICYIPHGYQSLWY